MSGVDERRAHAGATKAFPCLHCLCGRLVRADRATFIADMESQFPVAYPLWKHTIRNEDGDMSVLVACLGKLITFQRSARIEEGKVAAGPSNEVKTKLLDMWLAAETGF